MRALTDGTVLREDTEEVVREVCLAYGFNKSGIEICRVRMESPDAVEVALVSCYMAKLLVRS